MAAIKPSGPTAGWRTPGYEPRPQRRCSIGLAPGTATSNGGVLYEIIPVNGALRMRVNIKTATNGGTLDCFGIGPDFDLTQEQQSVAYGSLTGTIYSAGNMTQVAVTAGTEATGTLDLYGWAYVILKFTGTVGAGTITYVDVAQHMDHT